MKIKKYAAIDIGSNAVRLLIANVITKKDKETLYRKSSLVRVPIRLGADSFVKGSISKENIKRMINAMNAFKLLMESSLETVKVSAMVFGILVGATAFSMVFTYTGGDTIVEEFMMNLPGEKWGFLILSMLAIMILGFFIDFIEISYIIVPILVPIAENIGISPIWFAILIAMNLQTSFLTPPFGFSLFYLKGVAPPEVKTMHIYRGVVPFIALQAAVLLLMIVYPQIFGISPMIHH